VWWLQEFVSPVHGLAFTFGDRFSHQLIARLSSQVIVNSWAVGRHFSPPVPPERVSVVFPSVGSRGLPSNRVVAGELRLLMLGTVAPGKGCDVAIRSLAHLGDAPFTVKLRIVGEGEPRYLRALRGLAQTLHVEEQVEFVPFTRKPDVEIETANALLMCSEDEAFGRVTAEALVNGRPVIGANSGGTPELIADGLDGLLFPPGDAESLSMQIRTLGTDPSRLRHMAIEARSRNEHRFSRAAEVNEFTTVLQRTLR
jgi:glycosyltransferase involved in cell wall biosynthesis